MKIITHCDPLHRIVEEEFRCDRCLSVMTVEAVDCWHKELFDKDERLTSSSMRFNCGVCRAEHLTDGIDEEQLADLKRFAGGTVHEGETEK